MNITLYQYLIIKIIVCHVIKKKNPLGLKWKQVEVDEIDETETNKITIPPTLALPSPSSVDKTISFDEASTKRNKRKQYRKKYRKKYH